MTDSRACRDQHYGDRTYSQHGEDLVLVNLFKLLEIDKPTYLDLGAHHPWHISNTALLYERGSSGVNVEANPNLFEELRICRIRDRNLNVGVAPEAGKREFLMYSDTHGRNTFSRDETDQMKGILKVRRTMELEVWTIKQILDHACDGVYPDLLLTDIEGLDYAVLASADFSATKPKVIVTEVRRDNSSPIKFLLGTQGYFCYARMGENLIFVLNEFIPQLY